MLWLSHELSQPADFEGPIRNADGRQSKFLVQETRTRILVQELCPCVISSRIRLFSRTRNLDELEQCSILYEKLGVT